MPDADVNTRLLPYAKISSEKWRNANVEAKKNTPSSAEDIIHAWESGIDKGMNTTQQVLLRSFEDNMKKAFATAEDLFKKIKSLKVDVKQLFLKANNIASFDIMFVVNKKDYLSDKRKEAYSIARQIKKEKREDIFSINFSFMPETSKLIDECLHADGYIYKYDIKARKA